MNSFINKIGKVFSYVIVLRNKYILLTIVSVVSIFLELLGLGIFIPGIDFLSNQDSIKSLSFFNLELQTLSKEFLLLIFLVIVFSVFFLKALVNLYLSYLQSKLSSEVDEIISLKVYSLILSKSYEEFREESNSSYTSIIINEVEQFSELVKHIITLIIELFILTGIFVFLFFAQPYSTFLIIFFCSIYFLIMKLVFKKRLIIWGENRQLYQDLIYRDIKNGLSSIIFILIKKNKDYFLNSFIKNLKSRNFFTKRQYAFSQFPRISLELMSILVICLVVIINIFLIEITIEETISQLIFFAISLSRLLPSFNRIFTSYNFINYSESVINKIYSFLKNESTEDYSMIPASSEILLNDKILIRKISYLYPNSNKHILKDINFEIKNKSILAIAGKSGSGKSTLINLIMGLMKPSNGEILIDDNVLNEENIASYQKMIGFVSQKTPIINGSIKENICFGNINYKKEDLQNSIKLAELENFVENQNRKIETIIGEDGTTISGGEIQRIGIARALLSNPKILILDEATNALDKNTEELILNTIKKLKKELTIILVSHDKNVINIADNVYYIK